MPCRHICPYLCSSDRVGVPENGILGACSRSVAWLQNIPPNRTSLSGDVGSIWLSLSSSTYRQRLRPIVLPSPRPGTIKPSCQGSPLHHLFNPGQAVAVPSLKNHVLGHLWVTFTWLKGVLLWVPLLRFPFCGWVTPVVVLHGARRFRDS